jgi:LysR family glycine cleavage system transcriptional activator
MKAAEDLCVTPAAVSRGVRALEDYLGCTLFHRRHRQVVLTEDGQRYLHDLGDAFERIALAGANLVARRSKRPLVICAFPSFTIEWLIPHWSHSAQRREDFDLRFVTTHTHSIDFSGEIDVAILTDRAVYGDNNCESLFIANLVPICSPNYLPPGTTIEDTGEWSDQLLFSETRPNDWARWAEINGRTEFDCYRGRRFESSPLMYQAASAGMGIGIGIEQTLERAIKTGTLVNPFPASKPAPCPFYLIWPAATENHPFFSAFRRWIHAEVAAGSYKR